MKILFDTSVLTAALCLAHPFHSRAAPILDRARNRDFEWFISLHTIAELYSGLTRLPVTPKISPEDVESLITENVVDSATIVSYTLTDYLAVVRRMSGLGISGATIYDALIAHAAQKADVDQLLTFNASDFARVWPEGSTKILVPQG